MNRRVGIRILENAGYTVLVATNGREALDVIAGQTVRLVLMDIQMPEMDGLEATAEIRKRERGTGAHLPIIALTAHARTSDREKCLEAGMDAYISKPIVARDLLALVRKFSEEPVGVA